MTISSDDLSYKSKSSIAFFFWKKKRATAEI
jgi:hypothetical protein